MITRHLDVVQRSSTAEGLKNDNKALTSKNPRYVSSVAFNNIVTLSDITSWTEVYLKSFPQEGEKYIRNSLYQVTHTRSFLTYLKTLLNEKVLKPKNSPLVTHFIETVKVDVLGIYTTGDSLKNYDDVDLATVG